jgi:RHS repeat-associated protein
MTQQTQLTAGYTDLTNFYFSEAGRLGTRIMPDGISVFYSYDSAGRAASVSFPPGGAFGSGSTPVQNMTYLPFGPMTSYQLNGQTITRRYDANYALTDITSTALNLHFTRDPMGNINAEGNTPGASPATETYGYDPLQRLTGIQQGGTAIESLTYNPTGDRTSKAGSGLATGTYGYQTGTHWLTSIGSAARTYDANGNTTGNSSAGQTWGYGYNGRNRLTVAQVGGSTVGTYTYNALGQRIQKTTTVPTAATQRFFYDEQGHLIGEYTDGGNSRDTIWLGDMPVATIDTTGTTTAVNYVIGDQLGTPRAVVNSAGSTIWSWPYVGNAFGELAPISATGYTLNLRFPGQYFDTESGLVHNSYRDYCVECGRYIQSDPLGLFSGQLSTYAYVDGQPLTYEDMFGLAAGHHEFPQSIWRGLKNLSRDASKLFDDAVINPANRHGWTRQHAAYNRIAKKAWERFCESTRANTKEVTKEVAQEFLDYLRTNPQIARFNTQIRTGEPLTMPNEEQPGAPPPAAAEPPLTESPLVEPPVAVPPTTIPATGPTMTDPLLEPLIIP